MLPTCPRQPVLNVENGSHSILRVVPFTYALLLRLVCRTVQVTTAVVPVPCHSTNIRTASAHNCRLRYVSLSRFQASRLQFMDVVDHITSH
jgi:hypothetical protein